jgi:uncharacterized membrane protein
VIRYRQLDALRGVAVVGMVLFHLAAVTVWPPAQSAGLFVFTIFVVVAGAFTRLRLGRRYWEVVAAFVLSWVPAAMVGLTTWGVLGKWALLIPATVLLPAFPLIGWAMAGTYLVFYGDPGFGVLLFGWVLGRAMGPAALADSCVGVPTWGWLCWAGRHSLSIYVGHLWALWGWLLLLGVRSALL